MWLLPVFKPEFVFNSESEDQHSSAEAWIPLPPLTVFRLGSACLANDSERAAMILRAAQSDAAFACWLAASSAVAEESSLEVLAASVDLLVRFSPFKVCGVSTRRLTAWRKRAAALNALACKRSHVATALARQEANASFKTVARQSALLALLADGPKWLKLGREIATNAAAISPITIRETLPRRESDTSEDVARKGVTQLDAACLARELKWRSLLPPELGTASKAVKKLGVAMRKHPKSKSKNKLSTKQVLKQLKGKQDEHLLMPAAIHVAAANAMLEVRPRKPGKKLKRLLRSATIASQSANRVWRPVATLDSRDLEAFVLAATIGRGQARSDLSGDLARQLEQEKLEAMAELAAGAGHEINNPIAVISGRAELLARDEDDPKRHRDLLIIKAQANRVYEMIAGMMFFARPPRPQLAECDTGQLVSSLLDEIGDLAAAREIELVGEGLTRPIPITADHAQVAAALRAVYDNALFAIGSGGRIVTNLTVGESVCGDSANHAARRAIHVTISDDGPGIPPEIRRHLFDPFYSGRQAGRGLGIGLAKAWRIITQHGGSIHVTSEAGHGAEFRIVLPAE